MTSARERVLDAYETCLLDQGSASLEAVATAAGVSKGGLIYHFPSKDAMNDGLVERLVALGREDLTAMSGGAPTAVGHFIHTASDPTSPLGVTCMAVQLLARSGCAPAAQALRELDQQWYDTLLAATGDPLVAKIAQLVGDGIYYNAALGAADPDQPRPVVPPEDERTRIVAAVLSLLNA